METLKKESEFFHKISPKVLELVSEKFRKGGKILHKVEDKESLNFATQADLDVEEIIVMEIRRLFPGDIILAEEGFSKQKIESGRLWIIDPICGTGNFARELSNFVTNIALAENGELIAACAIDHNQKEYIWSVGENKIFIKDKLQKIEKKSPGIVIDIDLGVMPESDEKLREAYSKFVSNLVQKTNHTLISYNTSLIFAYASVGRIDAYISPLHKLWDLAAANFLLLQSGGLLTDLSGKKWTLNSTSVVAARDRSLHKQLLNLLSL